MKEVNHFLRFKQPALEDGTDDVDPIEKKSSIFPRLSAKMKTLIVFVVIFFIIAIKRNLDYRNFYKNLRG